MLNVSQLYLITRCLTPTQRGIFIDLLTYNIAFGGINCVNDEKMKDVLKFCNCKSSKIVIEVLFKMFSEVEEGVFTRKDFKHLLKQP